jgi:hypothetical protein
MRTRITFVISPEGKLDYCSRQGRRTVVYPVEVKVNKPGLFGYIPSRLCGDCLPDIIADAKRQVGKSSVTVIDHRSAANN